MQSKLKHLSEFWESNFLKCPPVSHIVRSRSTQWTRFYTLPQAKLWPDTEAELKEILERHNALLTDLLPPRTEFLVITPEYSEFPSVPAELRYGQPDSLYWRSVALHEIENDPEPNYWHFFVSERTWSKRALDEFLIAVAQDEVENALLVAPDRKLVYHPYDGGADIYLAPERDLEHIKRQHAEWLDTSEPDDSSEIVL
jgi:hypothetical protein